MYTILNMNWTPSQFSRLNNKEKAFVIASIDIRIQADEEEKRKMKNG